MGSDYRPEQLSIHLHAEDVDVLVRFGLGETQGGLAADISEEEQACTEAARAAATTTAPERFQVRKKGSRQWDRRTPSTVVRWVFGKGKKKLVLIPLRPCQRAELRHLQFFTAASGVCRRVGAKSSARLRAALRSTVLSHRVLVFRLRHYRSSE
ncbi:protein of unknown function [Methylocaldum szegediense]|uniref:Uncharacterized protein n=1 Tax=Methylocaldum szegediense TaxID=73780 RepID=A0ABN8WZJ1_9GAMM|nr:protein of unknown function [Methylocaldum szegediense]